MTHGPLQRLFASMPLVGGAMANSLTMAGGITPFFQPNPAAFLSPHAPLGAEGAGYYSTVPLRATLGALVDFDLANAGPVRLTVGAANVRTGEMRYFDSRDRALDTRHVMASGPCRRPSRQSASTATSTGMAGSWRQPAAPGRPAVRQ